ncbi:hypothetical protein GCM10009555_018210 [Acrocarpospora macrocephala]|uniref:Uncharacterized protein n=1 Tax=Acrocarpospora macrocephala TaxID=150177 RepID=A0A5M3WJW3_9ACTN|nr:hypothetical protein [Acrocarpospora macrocephala]GES07481.1 hypothetical protein Amac_010760 [Acrocarpospora macrocephala]
MTNNIQPTGSGAIEPIPSGDDPLTLPLHLIDRMNAHLDAEIAHMQGSGGELIRQLEEQAAAVRADADRRIAELAAEAERVRSGVDADVARVHALGVELARRAQAAGVRS